MINIIITVLGIDQGLANCGYGIVQLHIDDIGEIIEKKVIKKGIITTNSKKDKPQRVEQIYKKLKEIIEEYKPTVISCERLFFTPPKKGQRKKSASIITTNMITGIIYLLAGEMNIFLKDFVPSEVKKTITNNGKASKDDIRREILKKLNLTEEDVKIEHIADAISIGYTGALYYKKTYANGGE